MTQLEESLVATSLQTIISDQAFAMHGLTQISDIQTVLKEMHDKKEIQDQQGVQDKQETLTQSQSIDSSMSGQNSRQGSRAASRAPSSSSSRAGSRAVSPSHTPISLSRTNSFNRMKSDLPSTPESPGINPYIINKEAIPVIDEKKDEKKNEKDVDDGVGDEHDDKKKIKKNNGDGVDDDNEGGGDDDEDEDEEDITKTGDTSFARLASQLVAMIKQAEEAVEVPVKGREPKPRQLSNASQASQFDFDNLINDLDNYLEEDGEGVAEEGLIKTPKENTDPIQDRKKVGHSKQKSRQEEEFQQSLDVFAKNFNNILAEIEHEVGGNDDAGMLNGEIISPNMLSSQYIDPINHPSEDLADLDDFAQQCRLLTRALILPFLHATHSFMSESLQTTNTSYTPRSVTSTTRSFMNLMYWTFLFTLGTLVLDAWLCEVAGQQVIRMVGMLKPGQVFNNIDKNNNIEHQHHNAIELDHQDGDAKMVEDSKKKNVKICTCLEMKAVTYLINNNNNFYTNNNNTNINNHNNEKQDNFLQSPIAINDSNYYINNNHYNINNNNNNKRSSISSNINYSDNIIDQQRQKDNNDIHDHEMEEHEEEDLDLNIPGSFPSAFKWTPQSSHLNINNRKDNVRRVKSVVLRRPKRNGSFSSSGGHWVVKTRKVRTRHNNNNNKILKRNNSKSSSFSKNKGPTKSTSLSERIWVRRNSI